jgi:hypothetical protein
MTTLHARRFPKLAIWMAGVYLAFSLLVYFGTLGGDGHGWWPIWLYPVIWPLSALIELAGNAIYNPRNPMLDDYVAGAFYIVLGTVWIWFIGRLISGVATRFFPSGQSVT